MLTGVVAETEEEFTSSKQAWHVQSLEAIKLVAEGGPRLPQPMHKGQAETRLEVRMGKSLAWGTGAAVATTGVTVVGSAPPFSCSDADAGAVAVADAHRRSGGSSCVCAGASWSGALEEEKPLSDAR
jgi:hypothetical protein